MGRRDLWILMEYIHYFFKRVNAISEQTETAERGGVLRSHTFAYNCRSNGGWNTLIRWFGMVQ